MRRKLCMAVSFMVFMLFISGCGGNGDSTPVVPTVPAAPTGVIAAAGDNAVTISWNPVTGATSYNIYWADTDNVTKTTGTAIADVNSPHEVTGLVNGTAYYFVVTAENASGESVESEEVTATPSVVAPPAAPANPEAVTGDGEVTITWDAVSGATSYNIYWDNTTGVSKATGTLEEDVDSPYTLTGLVNGTTYYFVVTAVNANGESVESDEVNATPTLVPAPAAPDNVSATPGPGKVTITWDNVTGATSYNIYWAEGSGVTKSDTKIMAVTSPTDVTGLIRGTLYSFVVTAVGAGGESVESDPPVTATPLPPDPNFSQSDLAGIWRIRVILAGTDPGWYALTATVDSLGNITLVSDTDGTVAPPDVSGLSLTTGTGASGGVVTEKGTDNNATFHGKMSSGKNLIVGTSTQGTSSALYIFVKRVPGVVFTEDDLADKEFGYLRTYTGSKRFWEKGFGSTDASGVFTLASLEDSSGTLTPPSPATISVDSSGIVTIDDELTFNGVMSADKKIIVGASTDNTGIGIYSLRVIQIRGQTYTSDDLEGTIVPHAFHSTTASSWAYATRDVTIVDSSTVDESFVDFLNSDGGTIPPADFQITIDGDGNIDLPGSASSAGGMLSFGKDLLVRIGDFGDGSFVEITAQ